MIDGLSTFFFLPSKFKGTVTYHWFPLQQVAKKRMALNELVATCGSGSGSKKARLTSEEVQRVVSWIDDALAQTANHVQVLQYSTFYRPFSRENCQTPACNHILSVPFASPMLLPHHILCRLILP